MTNNERAVVAACADTMFPPGGQISISGTEAGIVAYVDAYLLGLHWVRQILVRLLFLFIQFGPLLFGPRRSRFTRLSHADRTRAFEEMAVVQVYFRRVAFLSMRTIMTFGYFNCKIVDSTVMKRRHDTVSP